MIHLIWLIPAFGVGYILGMIEFYFTTRKALRRLEQRVRDMNEPRPR